MQYKSNRALLGTTALILVAVMMFAFSGCSAVITNPVVAKVGDVEILYSQFSNAYSNYLSYYQYGLFTLTSDDPEAELKQMVFDALISGAIPIAQAHKEGITLDDEGEKQLAENVKTQIDTALAQYADQVDESITDEAAIREAEMDLFVAYLKDYKLTYNEYEKLIEEQERENLLAQKIKEQVISSASVTEEEAKTWYDEQLSAQQEKYATDPGAYYTDWQNAQYDGAVSPLVVPDGYFYVKHILVKNAEEGEEKDVDAIVAEIQAKLAAGESFEALIEEYNEDEGQEQEAYKNGYLISEANASGYDPAFAAAALALEVGQISEPVTSQYGVHLILKTGPVDTTPVSFESVKDAIIEQLLTEEQDTLYSEAVEKWRGELTIVQYDARVKTVGQNS